MPVKSLSEDQKTVIAHYFVTKTATISELAKLYSRSTRTIYRALEERGIDTGVKKRVPQTKPVPMTQVIFTRPSLWQRIKNWFGYSYTSQTQGNHRS